jgi:hypothetical protein
VKVHIEINKLRDVNLPRFFEGYGVRIFFKLSKLRRMFIEDADSQLCDISFRDSKFVENFVLQYFHLKIEIQ